MECAYCHEKEDGYEYGLWFCSESCFENYVNEALSLKLREKNQK